jgi:hypothetical protein
MATKRPSRSQRPTAAVISKTPKSPGRKAGSALFQDAHGRFTLSAYIFMNVIFDVFCVLNLIFITQSLRENRGLYFFFGILMAGFFMVSVYDFLFDRIVPMPAGEEADEHGYSKG